MDDRFFETRTVTDVKTAVNKSLDNHAYMSVVPLKKDKLGGVTEIDLVVGAAYRNKCAAGFDKQALGNLIDVLLYLHGVMK